MTESEEIYKLHHGKQGISETHVFLYSGKYEGYVESKLWSEFKQLVNLNGCGDIEFNIGPGTPDIKVSQFMKFVSVFDNCEDIVLLTHAMHLKNTINAFSKFDSIYDQVWCKYHLENTYKNTQVLEISQIGFVGNNPTFDIARSKYLITDRERKKLDSYINKMQYMDLDKESTQIVINEKRCEEDPEITWGDVLKMSISYKYINIYNLKLFEQLATIKINDIPIVKKIKELKHSE